MNQTKKMCTCTSEERTSTLDVALQETCTNKVRFTESTQSVVYSNDDDFLCGEHVTGVNLRRALHERARVKPDEHRPQLMLVMVIVVVVNCVLKYKNAHDSMNHTNEMPDH